MASMARFEGKVVMVSGGANGIGEACVKRFHEEGAMVAVIDRSDADLSTNLADLAGDRLLAVTGDCTEKSVLEGFLADTDRRFGPTDVLVNNVGQSARERASRFESSSEEVWRFVLEVSLLTTMRLSRLVVGSMRERGGAIVNMASDAAFVGDEGLADYAAAKMGIVGFTRALAREMAPYRTTVNAVAPGAIRTRAHDKLPRQTVERLRDGTPAGYIAEPKDVAGAVCFLASSDARYITGQTLLVDGGRWMV